MATRLRFRTAQNQRSSFIICWQLLATFTLICLSDNLQAQELVPFHRNRQWGYQTAQGKEVIEPQYQFAQRFKDQYAVVGNHDHVGVINQQNQLIIPFAYHYIGHLDKDRFTAGFRDKYFGEYKMGVIDAKNQTIIEPVFRSVDWRANHYVVQTTKDSLIESGEFRGSRAVKSTYGLYNWTGKEVIPCQYDYFQWLNDSLLVLTKNNSNALYRVTGQALTAFDYRAIGELSEGLIKVVKGNLHGFINQSGKIVITPRFRLSEPFSNGLAMVMIDDKWGAIDHQGNFVIEAQHTFDEVKAMLSKRPKE